MKRMLTFHRKIWHVLCIEADNWSAVKMEGAKLSDGNMWWLFPTWKRKECAIEWELKWKVKRVIIEKKIISNLRLKGKIWSPFVLYTITHTFLRGTERPVARLGLKKQSVIKNISISSSTVYTVGRKELTPLK